MTGRSPVTPVSDEMSQKWSFTWQVFSSNSVLSLSVRKLMQEDGSLRTAFRNMDEPLVKSALLRDAIGTAPLEDVGAILVRGLLEIETLPAVLWPQELSFDAKELVRAAVAVVLLDVR